eukprot:15478335-Alexandrium_andersonii.AAC.1
MARHSTTHHNTPQHNTTHNTHTQHACTRSVVKKGAFDKRGSVAVLSRTSGRCIGPRLGVELASESKLGSGFPDLRVECTLGL